VLLLIFSPQQLLHLVRPCAGQTVSLNANEANAYSMRQGWGNYLMATSRNYIASVSGVCSGYKYCRLFWHFITYPVTTSLSPTISVPPNGRLLSARTKDWKLVAAESSCINGLKMGLIYRCYSTLFNHQL
jgi:hypothetical protein